MSGAVIRIVGRGLPGRSWRGHANVHVGVERRSEPVDLVPADAATAIFDVPVELVTHSTGDVDVRGPYVQGRPGQRFVYLSWGEVADDGGFAMFRRAKLNLAGMPDHVRTALAGGRAVTAELHLTDRDGGPVCASIPAAAVSWRVDG